MSEAGGVRLRARPLFGLAALVACMLVVLIGLEYHSAVSRERRVGQASTSSDGLGPSSLGAGQVASLSPGPVQDWTRTILGRPLFNPSRRPPSVSTAGPERPRLAGIVLAPGDRRAIFAGAGKARGVVAAVGQQAGAWHVLAIDAAGVRVMGPEGVRMLHPSRDPSGGTAGDDADTPALPEHPSILDLLQARNARPPGTPLLQMPALPPVLRDLVQPPQPPPASPQ